MSEEALYTRIRSIASERGVKPCQALFAVFLAALAEAKMLNQATANFLAKSAAPKLYAYMRAMGLVPVSSGEPVQDFEKLIKTVNEAFEIGPEPRIERSGEELLVGLGGDMCRYCPRGVGLAEIPWTACPFPRLLEGLLRSHGIKARIVPHRGDRRLVVKRDGLCWFHFRLEKG